MHGEGGMTLSDEIRGEESIIDRSSMFDGTLRTSRNLRIEGQARGELYCDGTIYIEEGAQVDAKIVAANVTVSGSLTGQVTCHSRLQIMPTGRVSGRVATASLIIQEGAIYEGELRMSNLDEEPVPGGAPTIAVSSGAVNQGPTPYRPARRGRDATDESQAETTAVGGETKESL